MKFQTDLKVSSNSIWHLLFLLVFFLASVPIVGIGQTKVVANNVSHKSGNEKMTSLLGCFGPCFVATVETPENATLDDNTSAKLLASPGIAVGLASYIGEIELQFPNSIPANQWTYVRIGTTDPGLLNVLLGGSLGNALGTVAGGLLFGKQEIEIDARTSSGSVLSRKSTDGFNTDRVRLVRDNNGNSFIAIKPASSYDRVRITNRSTSAVGAGTEFTLEVFSAVSFQNDGGYCGRPSYTSFDGGAGLSLSLLDLQDQHLERAIDGDELTYSLLKSSSAASINVGKSFSQFFYFPSKSPAGHSVNIKLALGSGGVVNTDLLGGIEVVFWDGTTQVYKRSLQSSLLNNTSVLALLGSGGAATLTFGPGKAFDRVEVRLNSSVGLSVLGSGVRIFDVQRYSGAAGCVNPLIGAPPSPTESPFDAPSCASSLVDFENVDFAQQAVDSNNETFATLHADAGSLLVGGATTGFVEMDLGRTLLANQTTYVRINYDKDVLDRLLGGSLGKLAADLANNLLLGNQYFEVEAKNGTTSVLKELSSNAFAGTADGVVTLVQDKVGRYYIAITPNKSYNRVRISNHVVALLPTGKKASLDVYNACFELGEDSCFPANFTSYKGGGLGISVGNISQVGVVDSYRAISDNSSDYSTINLGIAGVAANVFQTIYFNQGSKPNDYVKIRLAVEPSSLLSLDVLGRYKIRFYNGQTQVGPDYVLQQGLLNNIDLLTLFKSGGLVDLQFTPTGTFDRVDIGAESLASVNVATEPLRVYSVKRFGIDCPETIGESPFVTPICADKLVSATNADGVSNLFDADFDSYATLKSGAGTLLGLGNKYEGYVELGYGATVAAGTTSYIRVDFDPGVLKALVSGSLGNVVSGVLNNLVLGNHFFEVDVKMNTYNGQGAVVSSTSVANGSSAQASAGGNAIIRVVQDKLGRYYIAVTPAQAYNAVRITDKTNSALGLLAQPNTMNVYGMCHESSTDPCLSPFATSYEHSGISLGVNDLGGAGVANPHYAINEVNTTDYAEISNGTLAVGASTKQWIFFNSLSTSDDVVNIKFKTSGGAVDIDLLGGLEIKAYRGNVEVAQLNWQNGIINGINILQLLSTNQMVEVPFAPGVVYDRISVGVKTLVQGSVFPPVHLYGVTRCFAKAVPSFVAWKSFLVNNDVALKTVKGGEDIDYTIHVRNTGLLALNDLTITDAIPAHTTFVSAGNGGTVAGGVLTFANVNVPVGGTATVSFRVKVNTELTGVPSIYNVALVKKDVADPGTSTLPPSPTDPNNPDNSGGTGTTIPVLAVPTISTWKAAAATLSGAGVTSVSGGEDITYTIYIKNTGNQNLTGVVVSDVLPTGTTHKSGGALAGGTVTFSGLDILVGETKQVTFTVTVKNNLTGLTQIANVASVNAGGIPVSTAPADPAAPATGPAPGSQPGEPTVVPVTDKHNMVIWKAFVISNDPQKTTVRGGEEVEYTVYVRNTGNKDLTNIVITDPLPPGVTLISGSTNVTIPTLAVGATSQGYTFKVKVASDLTGITQIRNVATAQSTEINTPVESYPPLVNDPTQPNTGGGTGTVIPVQAVHSVQFTKSGLNQSGVKTAAIGNTITYTLTVVNNGNKDLTNVVLTDPLSAHVKLIEIDGVVTNGGTVTHNIPLLKVGETHQVELTFKVEVLTIPDNDEPLVNTATATFKDINGGDDTVSAVESLPTTCVTLTAANITLTNNLDWCAGLPVQLTASFASAGGITLLPPGADFIWRLNSPTGQVVHTGASYMPTITSTTTYYVSIEGEGACFQAPAKTVTVQIIEAPTVPTINTPAAVCEGTSITLTAVGTGTTYKWYKGTTELTTETTNTLTLSGNLGDAGLYSVKAVNNTGCESGASASVSVIINARPAKPTISSLPAGAVCSGTPVTLTASASAGTYQWYKGGTAIANANQATYVTTEGGVYTVTVTDLLTGCASDPSDGATVTVNVAPQITFVDGVSSITGIVNTPITLPSVVAEGGVTYQWYNNLGNPSTTGAAGPTATFATPGVYAYTVVATNTSTGCTSSATVLINVYTADSCPPQLVRVYANTESSDSFLTGGVTNGGLAVDGNVKTHSTITTGLGVLGIGTTWQNLQFADVVQKGTPVTIKLGKEYSGLAVAGGLSIVGTKRNGLGTPIDIGVLRPVAGGLVDLLAADNVFEYTFVPANVSGQPEDYDGIRIVQGALLSVAQNAKVYAAYYTVPGTVDCAPIDNVTNPDIQDLLHGVRDIGLGVLSATATVKDAWKAVDNDPDSFAEIWNGVSVAKQTFLTAVFKSRSMATDSVRIVTRVPGNQVLSLQLLKGYRIQRYLGAAKVGAALDETSSILDLKLLGAMGDGSQKVSLMIPPIADPFDRVEISYENLLGVLGEFTNVYDIGIMPTVTVGTQPGATVEVCQGAQITITEQDECTRYAVYDEAGNPLASSIDKLNFTVPANTTVGIHTYYVQAIRQGCAVGPRQPITVQVNELPRVENQPQSVTVHAGATASFSVALVNKTQVVTYQWQTSIDGTSWTDIANATAATYSVNVPANVAAVGPYGQYRVLIASDKGCTVESAAALLTVTREYGFDNDAIQKNGQNNNEHAVAGKPYTYTVQVENKGPSTILTGTSIYFRDLLSAGQTLTEVEYNGSTVVPGANGLFSLTMANEVAVGATFNFIVKVGVAADAPNTIKNTVHIWQDNPGTNINTLPPADGTATTPDIPVDRDYGWGDPDAVKKVGNAATATAGTGFGYTVTLTNKGTSTILPSTVLYLQDVLSAGQTMGTVSSSNGTVGAIGSNGAFNLTVANSVAPNQSITLTVNATVAADIAASIINNTIKVWSMDPAGDYSTPDGTATTPDIPVDRDYGWGDPDAVKKAGNAATATAGTGFGYTVTLTNKGTSTILPSTVLYLQDVLSAGQTMGTVSSSNGTVGAIGSNGAFNLTVANSVARNQSITLTVNATVAADIAASIINNTIKVWSMDPAGDYSTPDGTATTPDIPVDRDYGWGDPDAVKKAGNAATATAGTGFGYTVTLTNKGTSTILPSTVLYLQDVLSAGQTMGTVSSSNGTVGAIGSNGAFNLTVANSVAPNQSITLTVNATVAADIAASIINNTIKVWSMDPAGDYSTPDGTATTPDIPVDRDYGWGDPDAVKKAGNAATATAGTGFGYTVTLTNKGTSTILPSTVLYLQDVLSAGQTMGTVSSSNGTVGAIGSNGAFNLTVANSVAPNQSITLTVNATVAADIAASIINNTIKVWSMDPAGDYSTPDGTATTPDIPVDRDYGWGDPDAVKKAGNAATATAGTGFGYTVTLTNKGTSTILPSTVLYLQDVLSAGQTMGTVSSSNGTVGAIGSNGAFNLTVANSVAPNQSITLTVNATVAADIAASIINNTIKVWSMDPAGDYSTPDGTATTPDIPVDRDYGWGDPDAVKKAGNAATATAGTGFGYTVTLTNKGTSTILPSTVLYLQDVLSAGQTMGTVSSSNGTVGAIGSNGAFNLTVANSVAPNQSITLTVNATVAADIAASIINNTIKVWSMDPAGDYSTPDGTATTPDVTVNRTSNFKVEKTTTAAKAIAGQSVDFKVVLTNSGPSTAKTGHAIVVTEKPDGLVITGNDISIISGNATFDGIYNSGTGKFTIKVSQDIAIGSTIVLNIKGHVPGNATGVVKNGIEVDGDEDETPPIPVESQAKLTVTKVADQNPVKAGTNTTFTITISNSGPGEIASGRVIRLGEMPSAGLAISRYDITSNNGTVVGSGNTATVTTNKVVAVGGTIVVKVTAAVAADAPTTISNGVKVWGPDKPTTETPDDEDKTPEIPVVYETKLSITKRADQSRVKVREMTTFTLEVKNDGPAVLQAGKTISLVERPGQGLTIKEYAVTSNNATVSGTGNNAVLTTTASVPVGATIIVKVTAEIDEQSPDIIANGVSVWGPGKDPVKDPEDDRDDINPIPVDFLLISAQDDDAMVKAGAQVTIDVLANDIVTLSAINTATVAVVKQAQKGIAAVNINGTITYTADKNATGSDMFTYRVQDAKARWSNEAEVTVAILDNPLIIPNAFSPNNDNVNDQFVIVGVEAYDQISLTVINRWGNEVYRNDKYNNEWNGSGLNAGTYFYLIEATKAGKKEVFKGSVLIKRN